MFRNIAIDLIKDYIKNNNKVVRWDWLCRNPAAIDIIRDDIRNNEGKILIGIA